MCFGNGTYRPSGPAAILENRILSSLVLFVTKLAGSLQACLPLFHVQSCQKYIAGVPAKAGVDLLVGGGHLVASSPACGTAYAQLRERYGLRTCTRTVFQEAYSHIRSLFAYAESVTPATSLQELKSRVAADKSTASPTSTKAVPLQQVELRVSKGIQEGLLVNTTPYGTML